MDVILRDDHSNESYSSTAGTAIMTLQGVSHFSLHKYTMVLSSAFLPVLKCGHSYESHWAVLSGGPVSYSVNGGSNFWVCA